MTDTMTWRYKVGRNATTVFVEMNEQECGVLAFHNKDFNALRLKLAGLVLFVDETPAPAGAGRDL